MQDFADITSGGALWAATCAAGDPIILVYTPHDTLEEFQAAGDKQADVAYMTRAQCKFDGQGNPVSMTGSVGGFEWGVLDADKTSRRFVPVTGKCFRCSPASRQGVFLDHAILSPDKKSVSVPDDEWKSAIELLADALSLFRKVDKTSQDQ